MSVVVARAAAVASKAATRRSATRAAAASRPMWFPNAIAPAHLDGRYVGAELALVGIAPALCLGGAGGAAARRRCAARAPVDAERRHRAQEAAEGVLPVSGGEGARDWCGGTRSHFAVARGPREDSRPRRRASEGARVARAGVAAPPN